MTKVYLSIFLSVILICSNVYGVSDSMTNGSIIKGIKKTKKEELLRLYLEVFLASKDLNNAYYVAKIGCKKFAKNPYWWAKLADICIWTDRAQEALKAYLRLCEITKKRKI